MNITGITGQSGSGKTTAARLFEEYGFYHLDSDSIVHNKVHTNKSLLLQISQVFGNIYVKEGILQRKQLGALIFSDSAAYDRLMRLIMPYVTSEIQKEIDAHCNEMILLDAPLLFEYKLDLLCDRTVGVVSDNLVERICARDGIAPDAAAARLKNQKLHSFYREHCDFVIENNGDISALKEQISKIAGIILKGTKS